MLTYSRMAFIPPNKDGESVTKVIHVVVTSCRPPELTLPNMRNIAGEDILCELVNDYFVVTMDLAE